MADTLPRKLRSDAQENRERVLEAARELFGEAGLDVTMREIARRADVGPATLYRRYPTKQHLIVDAFHQEARACRAIVRDASTDPDPWRGLSTAIERLVVLNAQNQGFTEAFLSTYPEVIDFAAHRSAMLHDLVDLARRAQAAGALRPDFVIDDVVLILMAGRGLAGTSPSARGAAARRFAALAVDALRTAETNSPLPPRALLTAEVMRG